MLEKMYLKEPNYTDVLDRNVVKNFGNVKEEYEALRNGTMLYDCSEYGYYVVEGSAAGKFLENLSTKEIQYLNIGNISECYFLNNNAEIVASVFILKRENDFLVITPWEHAKAAEEWLVDNSQNYNDVAIKSLKGQVVGISVEGPYSWKLVRDALQVDVGAIPLRVFTNHTFENENLLVMRIGRTSEYGYLIVAEPSVGEKVYEKIVNEGTQMDFPFCEGGWDAIEIAMLEVHQPNFVRESKEVGNIFELEQQWYVQYDKEDYIGFERLREVFESGINRHSVCFMCDSISEDIKGATVSIGGEFIGTIIYALYSIKLDKQIGVALIENPYAQSGMVYNICGENGHQMDILTLSSPIVRPLSWDLKME